MPNGIDEIYSAIFASQKAAADECFADHEAMAQFTRCHNFLKDLEKIRNILTGRPEAACFDAAVNEYQYALTALILGHYRHAFGSLRLTFELLLATIYFSAHEVKLRQWHNGSRDLTWSGLIDPDKGVFSNNFVKAFNPDLVELRGSSLGLAQAVYRECSEYVHGNPKTHEMLSGQISFRPEMLSQYAEKVESIRLSVMYCFLFRYALILNGDLKSSIEPVMLDAFGHVSVVQDFFQEAPSD